MAAADLTITDDLDAPLTLANPLKIVNAPPGVITFAGKIRVQNAVGVDDAIGFTLLVQGRLTGTGDEFANTGLQVLDARSLRASISATSPVGVPTSPTGLGAGARIFLPLIPAESFVELDIEISLPANVSASGVTFIFIPEKGASQIGKAHRNGLVTGIGDSTVSYVADVDGAVAANGPADEFVAYPKSTLVIQGLQRFEPAQLIEFDDLDGSAVALAPGDSYAAVISEGLTAFTVTKGDKSAGTPTTPATPVGELSRALVIVPEGLVITSVTPLLVSEGNFLATFSGSDLAVSGGFANVDGFRIEPQTPTVVSLLSFVTAEVDLLVDLNGTLQTNLRDDPPLTGAPLPLWRAFTDGGGLITDLEDLRRGADVGYA